MSAPPQTARGVYSFTIKPASDDEFATMFGSVLATVEYPEAAE